MRLLRSVHAWAGLALAVLIVTVAASGVLLVFEADYLRGAFPAARQAPPADPVSLGRVIEAVQREFGSDARSVVFGTTEMGLHQVYLRDGGGAYLDAAGAVLDRWSARGRPELWLFDLHENLLGGSPGHVLAGALGLAAALFAITGLVLWVQGSHVLSGRLWPRSTRRAGMLAQHRELGAIAALPVLLFAMSGAAMVFDGATRSLLETLLPGDSVPAEPPAQAAAVMASTAWFDRMARAQARFPAATLRIVSFPDRDDRIVVRLRQPDEWHPNGRTRVELSATTGAVLTAIDATQQPRAARVQAALYPLHAAKIGGRAYDALAVYTGLALVSLAVVGAASFALRRWRSRRTRAAHGAVPAAEHDA